MIVACGGGGDTAAAAAAAVATAIPATTAPTMIVALQVTPSQTLLGL